MPSRRASVTSHDFQLIDFHHVDRKLFSYRNGKMATTLLNPSNDAGASGRHSHAGAWERGKIVQTIDFKN
jgi:hypothetical protein